jgi:hypothetical protein
MAWGTIPDWLAAVGTLCAFFTLIYEMQKDRREEQVSRVTAWAEFSNSEASKLADITATISNASEMAIYDVEVRVLGLLLETRHIPVLAPNSRRMEPFLAVEVDDKTSPPRVSIAFVDASDRVWTRTGSRFKIERGQS